MEKKNNKVSKKFTILIVVLSIIFLTGIIIAFVIFNNTPEKVVNKTLDGGEVSLSYSDESNVFTINTLTPTSDITGKKFDSVDKYFDFTVSTYFDEADEIEYEIYVKNVTDNDMIKNSDIKVYLEKQKKGTYKSVFEPNLFVPIEKKSKLGTDTDSMILYNEVKNDDSSDNYRLRMWAADTSKVDITKVKDFSVEIGINAIAR